MLEQGNYKVYAKVEDTIYTNNSGSYNITFYRGPATNGASDSKIKIFAPLIKIVRANAEYFMVTLFNGLVENSNFILYVRSMLVLAAVFLALTYLLGLVQQSYGTFILTLFKFGLVITLISPKSWDFYNKYLFNAVTHGVDDIVAVMIGDTNGNISSENSFFDNITNLVINKENLIRIKSIGSAGFFKAFTQKTDKWEGFINNPIMKFVMNFFSGIGIGWILCFILMRFLFIKFPILILMCVLQYIISILTTRILVATTPLFISFLLFKWTHH